MHIEPDSEYDSYLYSLNQNAAISTSNSATPTSGVTTILQTTNANTGTISATTSSITPSKFLS